MTADSVAAWRTMGAYFPAPEDPQPEELATVANAPHSRTASSIMPLHRRALSFAWRYRCALRLPAVNWWPQYGSFSLMPGFWSSETMVSRLAELVEPFDIGRIVNCSYELSMGSEAYITGRDSRTKMTFSHGGQLGIPPGQFAQILTEEAVKVPNNALGLISVKSGLKGRGLVNVSGFHVDPGYQGRLLFSVYNAGPNHIVLSRGTPTFLMWYADLDAPTSDLYTGKRANLTSIPDEEVMRLQGDVFTPQELIKKIRTLESRLRVLLWSVGTVTAALVALVIARLVG